LNIYAASGHPHPSGSKSDPDANDFTSNTIKLFTEIIECRPDGQILDLGIACNENIQFFTQRIQRLVACDMFSRLADSFHGNHLNHQIWQHLDYPAESFDGILLWELIDRLCEQDVTTLADLCHTMLKPDGLIVLFVLGEQQLASVVNSFVIGQDFRVHPRPQPHLDLPLCSRHNRDVLALMSAFTPVRSFVCRQGLREFIFRRDH
jgi:hypothetical protein